MERYLEGETIEPKELEETLAKGVAEASVFPVVCGAATKLIGVDRLAALICEIGPSPADRPPIEVQAGDKTVDVAPDPNGQPLAFVFRTVADPYVGKVSFLKVLSGTVRPDAQLTNTHTGQDERLHGLITMRGKEQDTVPELPAGDIGAVAKLAHATTGDTFSVKSEPVMLPAIELPEPLFAVAIEPKTKGDEDKLSTAIARAREDDPTLRVERSPETHETVLYGMGELHVATMVERMKAKFGVDVVTHPAKVPYKETLKKSAKAQGRLFGADRIRQGEIR